jgi:3-oxoacyl-[acyl-carrier-protein] synthase-1
MSGVATPATPVAAWAAADGRDAVLCGLGARTSVGQASLAVAAAVNAGISGLALHPGFADLDDEPVSFAADTLLPATVPLRERMVALLASVVGELLDGLPSGAARPDAVWIAVPEPRAGMPPDIGAELDVSLRRLGLPPARVVPAGHAAGLMAMQAAAAAVAERAVDLALVAGVDSYHHAQTIAALDANRRLMAGRNPGGFPVGEGAGACLIAHPAVAADRGLPVRARIVAAASAHEPEPLRSRNPCLGAGLSAVFRATAAGIRDVEGPRFGTAYCDLNGERYRNDEFVEAMMRTHAFFVDGHDYLSPADCWGDVGAASGPLFALLAIRAGERGAARHPVALLWAGADGGDRSAVALEVAIGARP